MEVLGSRFGSGGGLLLLPGVALIQPRMALVEMAYMRVHDNDLEMWDFHPSPPETFLMGHVFHWEIFGYAPPLL